MAAHPKLLLVRDPKYLESLRDERCILTGIPGQTHDPIVAAHIGTLGKGIKSSDDEALPFRSSLHMLGHQKGEISMIRSYAPDALLRDAFRALARERYKQWKDRK